MFQRILIVATAACAFGADPGFVPLFAGKSLAGWTLLGGKGPGYVARDGLLVCPADGGGNLLTDKQYSNFIIKFDFRMEAGGNNGLAVRAPKKAGSVAYEGMEIQIIDHEHPRYNTRKQPLKPVQFHGAVYDVIAPTANALKPVGEWNSEEVTLDGRKVRVVVNGTTILDTNLDSVTDPKVLAKHPGLKNTKGHVGWLGHGTLVEFRNIRIKELP